MTLVRFTHIIYTFLNFTKQQKGPFKMRIYERLDYERLTTATPFKINVTCRTCSPATWWTATGWCSSCPTLRARCFYPRPGQYKNLREISSDDMRFSSIKRITLTDWRLRNKKKVGALFLILKLWFVHCLHWIYLFNCVIRTIKWFAACLCESFRTPNQWYSIS